MNSPSASPTLFLGHSPDPDDAFMFYAMAAEKIPLLGYRFEHVLQDIQTLNERALRQELHLSAVSIHAYAHLLDHYALLPCGASMGDGYGRCSLLDQIILVFLQRMLLSRRKKSGYANT